MADVSKLKQARRSLGAPPSIEEASPNLRAPEIAPLPSPVEVGTESGPRRRDARSLRRTNRTLPFATRVSPEFDNRLRDIAERDGLKLVELLERALDAYEAQR
jgi:hypothetical protein